jgi:hypothetical protein
MMPAGEPYKGAAEYQENPRNASAPGGEVMIELNQRRNLDGLDLLGQAPHLGSLILSSVGPLAGAVEVLFLFEIGCSQKVDQRVETEEPEHHGVNDRNERITQNRVDFIEDAIDEASKRGADHGADQNTTARGTEMLPSFLWITLPMMALAKM